MTRHETLFSLRYAVRVLERHGALWARLNGLVRLAGLLAGSAAIAALTAQSTVLVIAFGVAFAVMQGIEFAIDPAGRAAQARAQRRAYADLLAHATQHDDGALEQHYRQAIAEDDVCVLDAIKQIAYNDVVAEQGCDTAHAYPLSPWQRRLASIS